MLRMAQFEMGGNSVFNGFQIKLIDLRFENQFDILQWRNSVKNRRSVYDNTILSRRNQTILLIIYHNTRRA